MSTAAYGDITAGILVGGRGRRMGGADKANLPLEHTTFLGHLLDELAGTVASVVLLGRRDQRFPEHSVPLLFDAAPDAGPLGGLVTLLERSPTPWVLLLACDLPHFHRGVVHCLAARRSAQVRACVPYVDAQAHPTCALYGRGLLATARRQLGAERYSLRGLLARVTHARVELPAALRGALYNVNTPEAYEQVRPR